MPNSVESIKILTKIYRQWLKECAYHKIQHHFDKKKKYSENCFCCIFIFSVRIIYTLWQGIISYRPFSFFRLASFALNILKHFLPKSNYTYQCINCPSLFKYQLKKKTNHLMSSNNHPLTTSNKARKCLKWKGKGGGLKKQTTGTSYDFDKIWSGAPDGSSGKLFLYRDANYFDKSQNIMFSMLHFAGKFTHILSHCLKLGKLPSLLWQNIQTCTL